MTVHLQAAAKAAIQLIREEQAITLKRYEPLDTKANNRNLEILEYAQLAFEEGVLLGLELAITHLMTEFKKAGLRL